MRQVALLGVVLWMAAVGCIAGLLYLSNGQVTESALADYGLVFIGYAAVTSLVARRCLDVSMILVAIWGAAVGYWGPRWYLFCDSAIERWASTIGLERALASPDIRVAVSMATAGILTSSLLYLLTRSSKIVMQSMIASLAVAGLTTVPETARWVEPMAVLGWHAVVAAGLCGWMVEGARRRASGCCPRCGCDVQGLTSPVCPSCSSMLAGTAAGPRLGTLNRRPV